MYEKIEINHLGLSVRRDQRFIIIINNRYNINKYAQQSRNLFPRRTKSVCIGTVDSSLRVKRYLEDVVTLVFDRALLFAVRVDGR